MIKNNKKCPYYKYCGGCNLQGLSYEKQLLKKQEYIDKLLSKLHKVNKIIGMNDPYNYRNKVQVTFGLDEKRNIICGNFIPSTHIIVPIDDCMISDEKANQIILTIKDLAIKYKLSIFDEDKLKGCLRHVQVRCSSTNEYMVILVVGISTIPNINLIIKDLLKKHKEIKTIVQNINRKHTSMVLGDKNITLFGKGYIEDVLCGKKFRLSPTSFYQVNKRQTEVLYNTAINYADFKGNETVVDAYCGIGTIGLIASSKIGKLIGIELNRRAIKDAVTNMKINKINNAVFLSDDAGHYMSRLAKDKCKIDAVIMDPPRSGADDKFLNSLVRLRPKKIVYISCGPESLRNNLKYLIKKDYQIEVIQPVDMFPYTNHVENIVLLSNKK
ncbi:MAG: 23S rRNA (uracil(1939)-C(5))-methyltransferase RlmD [Erysipelotrichaceae bacterium]|nr:23S rRNA (uracil(1939)-C(5))-methyltransferase RlmD [Erysipelotrichaceae bacterium]